MPCGECREYVDAVHGCYHWRPAMKRPNNSRPRETPPQTSAERSRRYKERKRNGLVGTAKKGSPPLADDERERRRAAIAKREAAELAWLRRVTVARELG